MALVADLSGLYALYDASEKYHRAVRQVLATERGAVIVPTVILADVDYLLREYLGIGAELDFLDGIRDARLDRRDGSAGERQYADRRRGMFDILGLCAAKCVKAFAGFTGYQGWIARLSGSYFARIT